MSTTINVYPTIPVLPLVEETRARTEKLFQDFLDQHRIPARLVVRAYVRDSIVEETWTAPAPLGLRWDPGDDPEAGQEIRFGYDLGGGEWFSSWPVCELRVDDEHELGECAASSPPQQSGSTASWWLTEELDDRVSIERLEAARAIPHMWWEYRKAGASAATSIAYGFSAAALAEASEGFLASYDSAFPGEIDGDVEHNGESVTQFLTWWGNRQIAFYGAESFTAGYYLARGWGSER